MPVRYWKIMKKRAEAAMNGSDHAERPRPYRQLPDAPHHQEAAFALQDAEDVRRVFNAARTFPVKGVTYTPATLGGVPGEWAQDPGASPRANLLYLHGGGYVGMSPVTHRPITGAFAKRGFRVFAPDYRLAPEHPFPFRCARRRHRRMAGAARPSVEGPCCVAGDSAGGGLSLALLLNLKGLNERNADAARLFSPWTDLAATGDSMRSNALRDPLLVSEGIETIAEAYAGTAGTRHPLVSPLYGDYAGLPPPIFYVERAKSCATTPCAHRRRRAPPA